MNKPRACPRPIIILILVLSLCVKDRSEAIQAARRDNAQLSA